MPMSYKDLRIDSSYETSGEKNKLVEDFYIPMLSETSNYFRIAGFFSSSSLAIASKGIEGLIKNNGKMRLLISPKISEQDLDVIKRTQSLDGYDFEFIKDLKIEDFSSLDNLEALAWMLSNKRLEIKIVVDKNSGNSLFHQKIGIGYDIDGNILSFSGSINETAQAWLSNIEEFKTFKSWEEGQLVYLLGDLKKFNSYWNDERQDIAMVLDIPESLKRKIIHAAPRDVNDLSIMKKFKNRKVERFPQISLFRHQKKAVDAWLENDKKLLMEMATGTGKTRTAIGCMLTQLNDTKNFLVIVATPQNTLSKQWKKDIEDELNIHLDQSEIVDGSVPKWEQKLETILLDLNSNLIDNAIVFSTHDTISNKKFIKIIKENKFNTKIMFICDEVHGIGSEHQQEALLDLYELRVGLSATPERMFDETGTAVIKKYFGGNSYEFTIADALGTINPLTGKPFLNPFNYYPVFVDLSPDERDKYLDYTKKIIRLQNMEDVDEKDLNLLKILRSNILKNAEQKLSTVEQLILSIDKKTKIKDTIIFASEKQAEEVLGMLGSHGITRSKITEHESTSKKVGSKGLSEREEFIDQFRNGNVQVLIGLKCLDEGIDIRNARIAILMASSTNPREYVQRIGRVIRPAKNKLTSEIYDLIVMPSDGQKIDLSILEKEARRALYIAKNAMNYEDIVNIFKEQGVEVENYD